MTVQTAAKGLIAGIAGILAISLTTGAAGAALPDGLQSDGDFAGIEVPDQTSRSAVDYWTPERMARAKSLDEPFELGDDVASPLAQPVDYGSRQVNPLTYPNRVHGKIFFQFPNGLPGYYSCSGTIVSSGSGSLVNTAAHCLYDTETKSVAAGLIFIPGYYEAGVPFGGWPATNLIVTKKWITKPNAYTDDFGFVRVAPVVGPIQVLGSRGIGFNQPRSQNYTEYGYPAEGRPEYDGNKLIRCKSGYLPDPGRFGKPKGLGMRCDSEGGTSGGGWVSQGSFVVSTSSHGYDSIPGKLFGPYFDNKVRSMYKANTAFWPSIGPIKCGNEVASIIGSAAKDKIRGTNGRDVIATLGGNDRIDGRGGSDRICGGSGKDKIKGGGGRDRIDGGPGKDKCGRKRKGDKRKSC